MLACLAARRIGTYQPSGTPAELMTETRVGRVRLSLFTRPYAIDALTIPHMRREPGGFAPVHYIRTNIGVQA